MPKPRSDRLKAYLIEVKETVVGFEDIDFEDINECGISGENALHRVVWEEADIAIAQELLELGIDVNAVADGDLNMTPLHVAVSKGNHEMIELLLDHGADLFAIDHLHCQPPFFDAMFHQRDDLVQLILRKIFGSIGDSDSSRKINESWLKFHERQVARIRQNIENQASNDS